MTEEQIRTVEALRAQGYAVIVWFPSELEGVPRKLVEDRSVDLGYQIIEDLK